MSTVAFFFDPSPPGQPEFYHRLERVFGGARWVHNRAIVEQWDAMLAERSMPTVAELVKSCIEIPATEEETSWINLVAKGVLIDELEVLVELAEESDYLLKAKSVRDLKLKTKKQAQEIVFPPDAFALLTGSEGHGDAVALYQVGTVEAPEDRRFAGVLDVGEAVKVTCSLSGTYKMTVYTES